MSTDRDTVKERALRKRPRATQPKQKRISPEAREVTRSEKAEKLEAEKEKYGIPTGTRMMDAERSTLDEMADQFDVTTSEMLRICARIGMATIGAGKYTPQIKGKRRARRGVNLPPLPKLNGG